MTSRTAIQAMLSLLLGMQVVNFRAGYQTHCIDTRPVLYCIDTYDTSEGLNRQYYNVLNLKKFLIFLALF